MLNLLEADEERIHEGGSPETGGVAVKDEPPAGQDEDSLADLRDQVQVVFHEQHAGEAGEFGQKVAEPPAFRIAEPRGGLVEQQQPGTRGDGAGELDHPLAFQRQ